MNDRQAPAEPVEKMYRSLYRIRRVEQEIARIYPSDQIMSPIHLSIGQEAISVAICEALEPSDIVYGSYRSHALYLAKGGDLKGMIAELYGKVTGCARGKAGSMHLIDVSAGVMGASAVVASTIPLAVGHALAIQMRGEKAVVVSFFGDGAAEEGVFHESLNFAALKKLPILFLCENNGLAIHSRQHERQAVGDVCKLAEAHGIPAARLQTMDTFQILQSARQDLSAIRHDRSGPRLIECVCSRWMEHVGPGHDFHLGYRQREEVEPWEQRDEVARLGEMLAPSVRQRIETETQTEIAAAFSQAERDPLPDDKELFEHLYAASSPAEPTPRRMAETSSQQRINRR